MTKEVTVKYIACDGTEFGAAVACEEYERRFPLKTYTVTCTETYSTTVEARCKEEAYKIAEDTAYDWMECPDSSDMNVEEVTE